MVISAIAAVAQNGVIGKDNAIPWYLQKDFQFFKKTTLNHHVIMGRKSFESIGRPLPKRTNIVITRSPFYVANGVTVVHSLEEALELAQENGEIEAFIIGGGTIYEESLPFWDKLYLTEVEVNIDGDVLFPSINPSEWTELHRESHLADEKNDHNFTIKIFERKL